MTTRSRSPIVASFRDRRQIACDEFIARARALPIFETSHPHSLPFDDISWDLHGHIVQTGSPKSSSISFKTPDSPRGRLSEPLPGRFGEAVKAVVAVKLWETRGARLGRSPFQFLADAGKKLHDIMTEDGIEGDPSRLTRDHLDRAVDRAGKSRRHVGQPLSEIARIWSEAGIAPDLEGYVFASRGGHSTRSRIQPERSRDPLNEAEIGAIADAFHAARSPLDQVATSILALLCCAPARIGEVLCLPVDAEVVEHPGDGFCDDDTAFDDDMRFHFGLRWWPEKGGRPLVKFVPKEMAPVAQEALARLRRHTEPARELASWMIANPDVMPLSDDLLHVRDSRRITTVELARLYDYHPDAVASKAGLRGVRRIKAGVYCFDSVEAYWRSQLPAGWPLLSETSGVTYDRALCVSFGYQLSDDYATESSRVMPIGSWIIGEALAPKRGRPSIFERLGLRLPDGTIPKITTHRIRHYLNTIAQRANVPQAHIAHWSGRKRVMQNADYDHTDIDAMVDQILRGRNEEFVAEVPAIVDDADEAAKSAFVRQNITSTPIGFCLGDLRFEPCAKAGACIDCTRLVCIAGDATRTENLRRDLDRRRTSVENFATAEAQGRRINPRAKAAAMGALEHGERLLAALEDPQNTGSIVRNAEVRSLPGFSHADRISDRIRPNLKEDSSS